MYFEDIYNTMKLFFSYSNVLVILFIIVIEICLHLSLLIHYDVRPKLLICDMDFFWSRSSYY